MAILATGMARSKVIDSDWPTDWSAAVATHAVSGSASNAASGPWSGSLNSGEDPTEVAATEEAPIGAETVCVPAPDTT